MRKIMTMSVAALALSFATAAMAQTAPMGSANGSPPMSSDSMGAGSSEAAPPAGPGTRHPRHAHHRRHHHSRHHAAHAGQAAPAQ